MPNPIRTIELVFGLKSLLSSGGASFIGRVGENGANAVKINVKTIRSRWPDGLYSINVTLSTAPTESYPVLAAASPDGNDCITWEVENTLLQTVGTITLEVWAETPGGKKVASGSRTFDILGSSISNAQAPNEYVPSWIGAVTNNANSAHLDANKAETARIATESAKEETLEAREAVNQVKSDVEELAADLHTWADSIYGILIPPPLSGLLDTTLINGGTPPL